MFLYNFRSKVLAHLLRGVEVDHLLRGVPPVTGPTLEPVDPVGGRTRVEELSADGLLLEAAVGVGPVVEALLVKAAAVLQGVAVRVATACDIALYIVLWECHKMQPAACIHTPGGEVVLPAAVLPCKISLILDVV